MVPTGGTGKAFVSELALLIQSFADGAAIEPFALKALMVMPVLLLQIRSARSRLHSPASGAPVDVQIAEARL